MVRPVITYLYCVLLAYHLLLITYCLLFICIDCGSPSTSPLAVPQSLSQHLHQGEFPLGPVPIIGPNAGGPGGGRGCPVSECSGAALGATVDSGLSGLGPGQQDQSCHDYSIKVVGVGVGVGSPIILSALCS